MRNNIAEACLSCRQSKVKCDETKPCSRCIKHDMECTVWREAEVASSNGASSTPPSSEKVLSSPSHDSTASTASSSPVNPAPRSLTASGGGQRPAQRRPVRNCIADACTECRKSKVKCDETKPCSRCIKQNKQNSCMSSQLRREAPAVPGANKKEGWGVWAPNPALPGQELWRALSQQSAVSTVSMPSNVSRQVQPAAAAPLSIDDRKAIDALLGPFVTSAKCEAQPESRCEKEYAAIMALVDLCQQQEPLPKRN